VPKSVFGLALARPGIDGELTVFSQTTPGDNCCGVTLKVLRSRFPSTICSSEVASGETGNDAGRRSNRPGGKLSGKRTAPMITSGKETPTALRCVPPTGITSFQDSEQYGLKGRFSGWSRALRGPLCSGRATQRPHPSMKRTPLIRCILRAGARWCRSPAIRMPVQYSAGVMKEHLHTTQPRRPVRCLEWARSRHANPAVEDAARALERLVQRNHRRSTGARQTLGEFTNDRRRNLDD